MFKNTQLVPQTSVHWQQAHSGVCALAPKNACVERSLNELLTPSEYSFYWSDRLNTDFATTELAATINVWNTTTQLLQTLHR